MREIFKSTAIKIFLSVVLVLVMLALFTNNAKSTFLSSGIDTVLSPFSKVSAAATSNNSNNKSIDELSSENKKLAKENSKLRSQLVDYYSTKIENQRLWKFYNLKKQNPEYTLIPATVLRRDTNADFYSFTIDKGKSSGVSVNDPIVTDNGLIGWVSEVDNDSCRVETLLSPRTSISVKDIASLDTGVVTGSEKYSNNNQTLLTKLPTNHKVKVGDIVTTTGISGLYPKDLVVGEVIEVIYDNFDTSFCAVIEPYDVIRKVTEVAVIIDFTNQGEVLLSSQYESSED